MNGQKTWKQALQGLLSSKVVSKLAVFSLQGQLLFEHGFSLQNQQQQQHLFDPEFISYIARLFRLHDLEQLPQCAIVLPPNRTTEQTNGPEVHPTGLMEIDWTNVANSPQSERKENEIPSLALPDEEGPRLDGVVMIKSTKPQGSSNTFVDTAPTVTIATTIPTPSASSTTVIRSNDETLETKYEDPTPPAEQPSQLPQPSQHEDDTSSISLSVDSSDPNHIRSIRLGEGPAFVPFMISTQSIHATTKFKRQGMVVNRLPFGYLLTICEKPVKCEQLIWLIEPFCDQFR